MNLIITKDSNTNGLLSQAIVFLNSLNLDKKIKKELEIIISELIYNIIKYTPRGEISLKLDKNQIIINAKDKGKGIQNLYLAILDGYSEQNTLGLGLSAIIRLSSEVEIETSQEGTNIIIKKDIFD